MMMNKKVLVIGLDCVPPEFVFRRYKKDMPNVRKLMENGIYGELRSSTPPSSTNAWLSMATGKGSDSFGIHDYIYRRNRSYRDIGVINSRMVKDDYIWDVLSRRGKKTITLNMPMTYPPKKINGFMVTGILTPSEESSYTYPDDLKTEINKRVGAYRIKVPDVRKIEKEDLLERIFKLTEMRFKLIKYMFRNKNWDFLMGVVYATDALMHNFWRYLDPEHRKYEDNEKTRERIMEYFIYLDKEIGEVVSEADKETTVILMSDHGAKRMDGRINLNDWLIREGYLVLKSKPKEPIQIFMADVDWRKTKAFAFGAYYASLFINVKGRDPEGCVEPGEEYKKLKKELINKLKKIPDDKGNEMKTKVFDIPEGENAPDLLIYFDDLHWGTNSVIPHQSLYSWATEKGPDDAIHSQTGFFVITGKDVKKRGYQGLKDIRDITPTILKIMDIKIPENMERKPIEI